MRAISVQDRKLEAARECVDVGTAVCQPRVQCLVRVLSDLGIRAAIVQDSRLRAIVRRLLVELALKSVRFSLWLSITRSSHDG